MRLALALKKPKQNNTIQYNTIVGNDVILSHFGLFFFHLPWHRMMSFLLT